MLFDFYDFDVTASLRYDYGVTHKFEKMAPIQMSYEDPTNKKRRYTLYDGIVLHRDVFDVKDWPHNPCKSLRVRWTVEGFYQEN